MEKAGAEKDTCREMHEKGSFFAQCNLLWGQMQNEVVKAMLLLVTRDANTCKLKMSVRLNRFSLFGDT